MKSNLFALSVLFFASKAVPLRAAEAEPPNVKRVVAVENVCAWPNLTLMRDGTIIAIFHNQPSHGGMEADLDCWASRDGLKWEKRSTVTKHEPQTNRMNHAAGLARNGDLVVLCSGWTNVKQPERPKQDTFRDAVLRPWVLRSSDGGRTWEKREAFPAAEKEWTEQIPFGDIWVGEDGALHTSCYQGEYEDPSQTFKTKSWRSWDFRSDDDGWTWTPVSIIGPKHNETDLFPLGGKSWLAAARAAQTDLIRSDDNGATWQKPQPVTGKNEINGHLNRLKDGRLLLTYGVRVAKRHGVCAKLSSDDGRTWGEPWRLAYSIENVDCGYPSSVQLADGKIVTAWYAKVSPEHNGYHMGVTVWDAPPLLDPTGSSAKALRRPESNIQSAPGTASTAQAGPGEPVQADEFRHARVIDAWEAYAKVLSFGKGQTLALVDDGCNMSLPAWKAAVDGVPKVRVTYDAVDGDNDPKHEGKGYHGSSIGYPSSLNFQGKLGVAYNNELAVVRSLECCHCKIADSKTLAAALQWVIDNHEKHRITTVNLAPVDDLEHAEPVATEIDSKLTELRKLGIWVSAPAGNHNFTKGISWPASQPDCFAIGAVVPGKDQIHLDRHEKIELLVPAKATSSSNAIACGAVMLLREAIEKSGYDWKADGKSLPEAMMAIMQKTGKPVEDKAVAGRTFKRLDVQAALEHVFAGGKK